MSTRQRSAERKRFEALLREVRGEAGLRQVDVARALGKPQSYVSKYESGERRLDLLEVRAVCQVLGLSLEEFVRRLEAELAEEETPKAP